LPDFPEPEEGSPGLLNSHVYVFNGSSIFRNITTEVGEVSHFPFCFVLQYDGIITFIINSQGDYRNCNNWRGITLLVTISRVFFTVLYWTDYQAYWKGIRKEHAGFRPDR
jgi:hypothetical protein